MTLQNVTCCIHPESEGKVGFNSVVLNVPNVIPSTLSIKTFTILLTGMACLCY